MQLAGRHKSAERVAVGRQPVHLFAELEHRIKNYALAAGAGCLFIARPLATEVLYTKADIHLQRGKVQLDFTAAALVVDLDL